MYLTRYGSTGTTALFDFLKTHPQVCPALAPGTPGEVTHPTKDVDFFNDLTHFRKGAHHYLSAFQRSHKCADAFAANRSAFFLDATATYLGDTAVAKRMKDTIPASMHRKLRFLIILREPVERDRAWTAEAMRRRQQPAVTDAQYPAILREKVKKAVVMQPMLVLCLMRMMHMMHLMHLACSRCTSDARAVKRMQRMQRMNQQLMALMMPMMMLMHRCS
jgi:hypothetical protein